MTMPYDDDYNQNIENIADQQPSTNHGNFIGPFENAPSYECHKVKSFKTAPIKYISSADQDNVHSPLVVSKKYLNSESYFLRDNFVRYTEHVPNIIGTKITLNPRSPLHLNDVDLRALEANKDDHSGEDLEDEHTKQRVEQVEDKLGIRKNYFDCTKKPLLERGNYSCDVPTEMNSRKKIDHPLFNTARYVSKFNLDIEADLKQAKRLGALGKKTVLIEHVSDTVISERGANIGENDDSECIEKVMQECTGTVRNNEHNNNNIISSGHINNANTESRHPQYGGDSSETLNQGCINLYTNDSTSPCENGDVDKLKKNVGNCLRAVKTAHDTKPLTSVCRQIISMVNEEISVEGNASPTDDGYGSETTNRSHLSNFSDTGILNTLKHTASGGLLFSNMSVVTGIQSEPFTSVQEGYLEADASNPITETMQTMQTMQTNEISFPAFEDVNFNSVDLEKDIPQISIVSTTIPLSDITSDRDVYQDDKFRRRKSIHAELENILKGQVQKINDKSATLPNKSHGKDLEPHNTSTLPTKNSIMDKLMLPDQHLNVNANELIPFPNNLVATTCYSLQDLDDCNVTDHFLQQRSQSAFSLNGDGEDKSVENRNSLLTELRNTISKEQLNDESMEDINGHFSTSSQTRDTNIPPPPHDKEAKSNCDDVVVSCVSVESHDFRMLQEQEVRKYSDSSIPGMFTIINNGMNNENTSRLRNRRLSPSIDENGVETFAKMRNEFGSTTNQKNVCNREESKLNGAEQESNDIYSTAECNNSDSNVFNSFPLETSRTVPTLTKPNEVTSYENTNGDLHEDIEHTDESPIDKVKVVAMLKSHLADKTGINGDSTEPAPMITSRPKPKSPGIGNLKPVNFNFSKSKTDYRNGGEQPGLCFYTAENKSHPPNQLFRFGQNNDVATSTASNRPTMNGIKSDPHTIQQTNTECQTRTNDCQQRNTGFTDLSTILNTDFELTKSELDYIRGDSSQLVTQVSENTYTYTIRDTKSDEKPSNGSSKNMLSKSNGTISLKVVDDPSTHSSKRSSNVSSVDVLSEQSTDKRISRSNSVRSSTGSRNEELESFHTKSCLSRSSSNISAPELHHGTSISKEKIWKSGALALPAPQANTSMLKRRSRSNSDISSIGNNNKMEWYESKYYPDNLDHFASRNSGRTLSGHKGQMRKESIVSQGHSSEDVRSKENQIKRRATKRFSNAGTQTYLSIEKLHICSRSRSPSRSIDNYALRKSASAGSSLHSIVDDPDFNYNNAMFRNSVEKAVFELTDSEIEYVQGRGIDTGLGKKCNSVPNVENYDAHLNGAIKQETLDDKGEAYIPIETKPNDLNGHDKQAVYIPPPDYDDVPLPEFTKCFCPPKNDSFQPVDHDEKPLIQPSSQQITNSHTSADEVEYHNIVENKHSSSCSLDSPSRTTGQVHNNNDEGFAFPGQNLANTVNEAYDNGYDPKNSWLYKKSSRRHIGRVDIPDMFQKYDPSSRNKQRKKKRSVDETRESGRITPTLLRSPMSSISKAIGKSFKMLLSPKYIPRTAQSTDCICNPNREKMNDIITRRTTINSATPWGFQDNHLITNGSRHVNGNSALSDSDDIDVSFITNNEWLKCQEIDERNYPTENKNKKNKQNEIVYDKVNPTLKQPMFSVGSQASPKHHHKRTGNGPTRKVNDIGKVILPHVLSEERPRLFSRKFRGRQKTFNVHRIMKSGIDDMEHMQKIAREAAFNSFDISKEYPLHYRSLP